MTQWTIHQFEERRLVKHIQVEKARRKQAQSLVDSTDSEPTDPTDATDPDQSTDAAPNALVSSSTIPEDSEANTLQSARKASVLGLRCVVRNESL